VTHHHGGVTTAVATFSGLGAFFESTGAFLARLGVAFLFALVAGVASTLGALIGRKIIERFGKKP